MVVVERRRQAEQRLQQAVDVGGGVEVAAAHDVRHALGGVVDRHREMVADRRVLAGEHDVAEGLRLGHHLGVPVAPVERPGRGGRPGHIEPPGMRLPDEAPGPLLRRQGAAGAGVERPVGTVRRRRAGGDLGGDRGAGAEAGISEAVGLEPR
jgi:hypothetical protein